MFKKLIAIAALGIVVVLAVPMAANAVDYTATPGASVVATGGKTLDQLVAGDSLAVTLPSFTPNEMVSATLTGDGVDGTSLNIAAVRAATTTKEAKAGLNGAAGFVITLPANAQGAYTLNATGRDSKIKGFATITVVPTDAGAGSGSNSNSSDGLAATGASFPMLLIWSIVGVLALGAALIAVRVAIRRQRASA